MRYRKLAATKILAIILVVIFNGCSKSTKNYGSRESFISVNQFPYFAAKYRREHLLGNYNKLRMGMRKDEVVNILGNPDFEKVLSDLTSKSYSTAWEYSIYKSAPYSTNNSQDSYLEIYFDQKEQLVDITKNNFP